METVTHNGATHKLTPAFAADLAIVLAGLQAKRPDLVGVLGRANAVLTDGRFLMSPAGTDALVTKVTAEGETVTYHVSEHDCDCAGHINHPTQMCKHMYAFHLFQIVQKRLERQPGRSTPAPITPPQDDDGWPDEEEMTNDPEPPDIHRIPKEYVQLVHGKPHVLYKGLLAMAYERGLVRLEAGFDSVTTTLAVAHATATFEDGRVFAEAADATPDNVNKGVAKHFPRCALTRAKARCLRDALNIGIAAVEEFD